MRTLWRWALVLVYGTVAGALAIFVLTVGHFVVFGRVLTNFPFFKCPGNLLIFFSLQDLNLYEAPLSNFCICFCHVTSPHRRRIDLEDKAKVVAYA